MVKRYNLRPMIDGDNVMDWPRDLRHGPSVVLASDYDALAARLAEAVAAVQAFADHFGPLEDNHMLNDECRHCFALARGVLGTADSADERPACDCKTWEPCKAPLHRDCKRLTSTVTDAQP